MNLVMLVVTAKVIVLVMVFVTMGGVGDSGSGGGYAKVGLLDVTNSVCFGDSVAEPLT